MRFISRFVGAFTRSFEAPPAELEADERSDRPKNRAFVLDINVWNWWRSILTYNSRFNYRGYIASAGVKVSRKESDASPTMIVDHAEAKYIFIKQRLDGVSKPNTAAY